MHGYQRGRGIEIEDEYREQNHDLHEFYKEDSLATSNFVGDIRALAKANGGLIPRMTYYLNKSVIDHLQTRVYLQRLSLIRFLNAMDDDEKTAQVGDFTTKYRNIKGKLKVVEINGERIRYAIEDRVCWAATAYYGSPDHSAVCYARGLRDYLMEVPGIIGDAATRISNFYSRVSNSNFARKWKDAVSSKGYDVRKTITSCVVRILQGIAKLAKVKPKKRGLELIVLR